MVGIDVKHYLNSDGLQFFENCWFPLVHAVMSQQPGFVLFEKNPMNDDCVSLKLQFADEESLQQWLRYPGHERMVDALDPYRTRKTWEARKGTEEWQTLESRQTRHEGLHVSEKIYGDFLSSKPKGVPYKTIEDLRSRFIGFGKYAGEAADIEFTDSTVQARDGAPLRIRSFNTQLPDNPPVLIFYPGCAFVFDVFDLNSIICSRIAEASGIKVILVQFRLAPEHPLPTSLYDSYDAAKSIAQNAKAFGIDPNKICVGGWCTGAHAATVVANLSRQGNDFRVHHQILFGGVYDQNHAPGAFDDFEAQDKTMSRKVLAKLRTDFYSIKDPFDPLVSPLHESDFKRFPPATILVGEFDAVRNDSEAYFQKLLMANVPVEKVLLTGQTHNTIALRSILNEGPDPAAVIGRLIQSKL